MIDLNVYYYELGNGVLWSANSLIRYTKNIDESFFFIIRGKFTRDSRTYNILRESIDVSTTG